MRTRMSRVPALMPLWGQRERDPRVCPEFHFQDGLLVYEQTTNIAGVCRVRGCEKGAGAQARACPQAQIRDRAERLDKITRRTSTPARRALPPYKVNAEEGAVYTCVNTCVQLLSEHKTHEHKANTGEHMSEHMCSGPE